MIRDLTHTRHLEDLAELARAAAAAEQEHRGQELLDRIVCSLFSAGLSLQAAISKPDEVARQAIGEALHGLDDTIRQIRDHLFTTRRQAQTPPSPPGDGELSAHAGDSAYALLSDGTTIEIRPAVPGDSLMRLRRYGGRLDRKWPPDQGRSLPDAGSSAPGHLPAGPRQSGANATCSASGPLPGSEEAPPAAGRIAPFYGAAPKPREAIRRLCPVVGSWPGKDFTTKAAGVLEADLTAAGIPHDLKVYPGAKHSFFNHQWRNYHAAAAADSWQQVQSFFAEHVRGSPAAAD